MKSSVKNLLFAVAIIAVFVAVFGTAFVKSNAEKAKKAEIEAQVTSIAQSQGLEDVEVVVGNKWSDYDIYSVVVKCSNLHEFSERQLYSLGDAMDRPVGIHVSSYRCNDDTYEIFPSTRSVYINGEQVHDDYWNSESHKSASSSSSSGKEKCDRCNGTGMVKYYYGDNATEAFLNGYEDSWYGQCGSCQGTGYR